MSAYVIPVLVLALFVFSFVAVLMVSVGSADDSAFDEQEPPKDRSLYLVQAHGAMLDDIQIRKGTLIADSMKAERDRAYVAWYSNQSQAYSDLENLRSSLRVIRGGDGAQTESR